MRRQHEDVETFTQSLSDDGGSPERSHRGAPGGAREDSGWRALGGRAGGVAARRQSPVPARRGPRGAGRLNGHPSSKRASSRGEGLAGGSFQLRAGSAKNTAKARSAARLAHTLANAMPRLTRYATGPKP